MSDDTSDSQSNSLNTEDFDTEKFWMKQGFRLINSSQNSMLQQIERLEKAIIWFWTVYLAFITLRTTVADDGITLIQAIPVGTLILAYLVATIAHSPVFAKFDLRIPENIRTAYNKSILTHMRLLWVTTIIVVISTLFIILALVE
jgi:hypothetical protein